jgi:hypothetical protein
VSDFFPITPDAPAPPADFHQAGDDPIEVAAPAAADEAAPELGRINDAGQWVGP